MTIERGPLAFSSMRAEVGVYLRDLRRFLARSGLQGFTGKIDHVAVKARDGQEYRRLLDQVAQHAKIIVVKEIEGRQIAVAELAETIPFGDLGGTCYLEIIQPKQGASVDVTFWIQHTEFVHQPFAEVVAVAARQDIAVRDHQGHKTLDFGINSWQQEIKFSDRPIEDVLLEQLARGESRIYFQRET